MSSGRSDGLSGKRWPIIFGVGIAVTIVAVTLGRGSHGDDASVPRQTDSRVTARTELGAPPSREPAASVQVAGAVASRGGELSPAVADLNRRRRALSGESAARDARLQEVAAARYAKEVTDPAWAFAQSRARARIAKDLSAAGVDSPADLATQCKRTVCRTTATFETPGRADQWALLYMASLGNTAKRSVVSHSQDAQGVVHLEIYSVSER